MKCPMNAFADCVGEECFLFVPAEEAELLSHVIAPLQPGGKHPPSCGLFFMKKALYLFLADRSGRILDSFERSVEEYGFPPDDAASTLAKAQKATRRALKLFLEFERELADLPR